MAGYKLLIIGETGRGKTRLLASLVGLVRALGVPTTVIDLAPEKAGVGAKVARYIDVSGLVYLTADFRAPRLEGKDAAEELALAKENAEKARSLFAKYLSSPTPFLAVNDLTIFLHAGDLEEALDLAESAKAFVATAYYGELLRDKGSGILERERRAVEELARRWPTIRL